MRIARVETSQGAAFAELTDDDAVLLDGDISTLRRTDRRLPMASVKLLAPVAPSKIICAGRNYALHAAEMGEAVPSEPRMFFKPPTTVIGVGDEIRLPRLSSDVSHEGELAVVIGRRARGIAVADALDIVMGYTCANDVTARDILASDGHWTRAKGFDTFCPLGPWIETDLDLSAGVRVRCSVNGKLRQDGTTLDLYFDVSHLVAYCSAFTTLLPGDVILTGTPAGVGPLHHGDTVTVAVEGIGELTNPCVADE